MGLDFSAESIKEARRQADLFDHRALQAAGLREGSLAGVVEHTCFCAIDPAQRQAYRTTVTSLLRPGGPSAAIRRSWRGNGASLAWSSEFGSRRSDTDQRIAARASSCRRRAANSCFSAWASSLNTPRSITS